MGGCGITGRMTAFVFIIPPIMNECIQQRGPKDNMTHYLSLRSAQSCERADTPITLTQLPSSWYA